MEASTSETLNFSENERRLNELMSEYIATRNFRRQHGVIAGLHPLVRKRVYALKNILKNTIELEAEFQRSVYSLERNFQDKHDDVFRKRNEIVNGHYEPSDEESKLPNTELDKIIPLEGQYEPKGIPNFWLNVLKNVECIRSMVQEHDEDILKHLVDIRTVSKAAPDLSYTIEFHFEPNEFFPNSILTKTYLMKCQPDEDDPFTFDGPEIYKTIGSEIMWNPGKKFSTLKRRSTVRLTNGEIESFFNFFNPPEHQVDDEPSTTARIEEMLEIDFEIGLHLKERVVPHAVLYFTAEIPDTFSIDGDDDNEEDDVDDEFTVEAFDSIETETETEADAETDTEVVNIDIGDDDDDSDTDNE